jgi:hypothetical protein
MLGYWMIVCHLIGDYLLQSDWMANEKTSKSIAALAHVATYSIPFWFVTDSSAAILVIAGTHFLIDRWRLARYVCWFKNFLSPGSERETVLEKYTPRDVTLRGDGTASVGGTAVPVERSKWWHRWEDCKGTGYHKDKPPWMSVWLMIIADNTLHLICNGLAVTYL